METKHFNRAQKRAQTIKDELQQLDPDHLDTFIDGVEAIEPPKYRRVGAKIVPDLVKVNLKKGAETYNIGNVYFEEANEVKNVNFRIDTATRNRFKVDRSDRLPKEGGNFLAIPIYQFVAQEFVPLWKVKYQRIVEHRDVINEKRQTAHHLFSQLPRRSVDGKAPGTQMGGYANQDDRMDNVAKSRKRVSGEPVTPHPSNKRARMGLLAMSDATKCETFAKIEDRFKVDLFDAMVKAAFPGFDNVMTAAWNVVSVYAVVGSEFEGLHEAVTDLKAVLEEFDAAQGDGQPKRAMRAKEVRDHSAINHRNGRKAATSSSEGTMEGVIREGRLTLPSTSQHNLINESAISGNGNEEAQKIACPTIRNAEEVSDDEARQEKFNDIKRRIESKPRYTPTPHLAPTHEREVSAARSDSTTQDEEEMVNEPIQRPDEQDRTPRESGRAEEDFDNTVSKDVPESFDPDNYHMRLKQEEREASEFNRMNKHERQYQPQPQPEQHLQHQPQGQLQFNQNGRGAYDTTKPMREENRGSREKGNERISPVNINQQSLNQNQAFDYPRARLQEIRKPQSPAEKPKATPGVWLGPSKLGAKKGPATGNAAAPVAPMLHNLQHGLQHGSQHAIRKDLNGTERRRPQ